MSNFSLTTVDSKFTYTSRLNTPATVKQALKNNNQYTSTQGFLIKAQVGRKRAEIEARVDDTKANIEDNILPMLTYPQNVNVTIDRNFIGRSVKTLEMVITGYSYDELGENQTGDGIIILKLIEVLETSVNV